MTHGIVTAPQPEAVEAGAEALKAGGNAIDAAVATALVQTAVDPQMCGIAGFGSMHLYLPTLGEHLLLDFYGRAPAAVKSDMWQDLIEREAEDGFGFILKDRVNEMGYQSITTPMTLRALDTALKRFGTMDIADLLQPAIHYAAEGFMVRPHVSYFWNVKEGAGRVPTIEKLKNYAATRAIYFKENGQLRAPGEILTNSDMANTYRRIAKDGVDDFYSGTIAQEIIEDMRTNGGMLAAGDLNLARTSDNPPLWGEYRGLRVATNPPPGGGVMVLEMLNILENFDLKSMGHNSIKYISTLSEAMKIATVDKDNYLGDPNFVDVPTERLISKTHGADMALRIKSGEKTYVSRLGPQVEESKDTTQVTSIDEHGNCVSLTHSLGMPSGVVSAGLGFMYNGCMAVFDPRPGNPDSLAPGKARFTAMCPTIVFKGDDPFFIVGAPGGTFITMGVLQVILNAVEFGMDAQQAISAPRFCATSNTIDVSNRILRSVEAGLNLNGYPTRRTYLSYHFAGVHAVRLTGAGWDGGADPGRDGMAIEV
ncbi:MAG: gamma-glutamyltransferase [Rhodospirillaceae bacterium TMED8]|nr:gamma-glutamyltransferase [Magnetovibrio sp.]OUT50500.1 MAG: gamma-glutamyltransferase [Rhodospirillaceae bacterium TMED8]|tara:strand:+ start:918 stop:2528 length:1611 start_codon:yes stop_codon:yes gene_type:complete